MRSGRGRARRCLVPVLVTGVLVMAALAPVLAAAAVPVAPVADGARLALGEPVGTSSSPAGLIDDFGSGIGTPTAITEGPGGDLWFVDDANSVGRLAKDGALTTFVDGTIDQPRGITTGPDGNVWFTNRGNNSIGRVTPAGVVSNFPDAGLTFAADITAGDDGNLWYTSKGSAFIGRITPAGTITHFSGSGIAFPDQITTGPGGNLWFTNGPGSIGTITPAGVTTVFSDPGISGPTSIVEGPDGNLWFTNGSANSIGRITTAGVVSTFTGTGVSNPQGIAATGRSTSVSVWFTNIGNNSIGRLTVTGTVTPVTTWSSFTGAELAQPTGLVTGLDGALWFTNAAGRSLGRMTTAGALTRFPGVEFPKGIVTGPDGNLWFAATNRSIGRLAPSGAMATFVHPSIVGPNDITAGPDGNLWFTNGGGDSIGRITPGGVVSSFADPSVDAPDGITLGPDGNLWFTNAGNDTIGRITPAGAIASFPGAGISYPMGITAGADGNLWFASYGGSIGRITPFGDVATFSAPGIGTPMGVTAGFDGNVWFASQSANAIGRVTPTGAITLVTGAEISAPVDITRGPDGAMWFASTGNQSVGRVAPDGTLAAFPAGVSSYPRSITPGPQGRLWFTDQANHAVKSISVFPGGSRFHGMTPFRAQDSRPGSGQVGFTGAIGPAQSKAVTVAPLNGIPAGATAVVMNVTVTGGTAASYLTAFPTGGSVPTAASLLFGPGQTVPNQVTVGVGAGGKVSFFNQLGSVHVVADVVGYYSDGDDLSGGLFDPLAPPQRLLDSRGGGNSTPSWNGAALGNDASRDLEVRGHAGVPPTATAVVMNVTVTGGTQASFLQAYPSGANRPVTANVLFGPGQTVPNLVTVGIGANGAVALYNQRGTTHVIADVVGYFDPTAGSRFHPLAPVRLVDSRLASGSTGQWSATPLGAGATRTLRTSPLPGGSTGVPDFASGLVANVTVTGGTAASFLAVAPKPGPLHPGTANLLFGVGQTVPNAVMVGIGPGQGVDVFNQLGTVHVIVDATGFFAAS